MFVCISVWGLGRTDLTAMHDTRCRLSRSVPPSSTSKSHLDIRNFPAVKVFVQVLVCQSPHAKC